MRGLWAAALAATLASCAASSAAPDSASSVTAFRHISVIPMSSETVLAGQNVIVRDGLIAAIGPAATTPIPRGARVIEGAGLYVMPGLVDGHVHPTARTELISYLLYGQTTLLALGGEGINELAGETTPIEPRLISSTTSLDATPPINRRFQSIGATGDIGSILDDMRSRGAQFVKVYTRVDLETMCAIHREAHARNMAVVSHIPQRLAAEDALRCTDMVAHGEEFFRYMGNPPTQERIDAMAALAAANNVYVMPNISAYAGMYRHATNLPAEIANPESAFISAPTFLEWQQSNNRYANRPNIQQFAAALQAGRGTLGRFTMALHSRGVTMLAGTDAPIMCFPGRCLIEELRLLKEAGLSRYEALRTATANYGRFAQDRMHLAGGRFGVIEAGARADLLVLGANPLATFDAFDDIRGVAVGGAYHTRDEIAAAREAMRASIAANQARAIQYDRLIEAGDVAGATRWLDAQSADSQFVDANVVIFDALALERDGRAAEAMPLLVAAARLTRRAHGLWNELGRLRAAAGDRVGAREAYQRALEIAPHNGVAQQGLAGLQ